MKTSIQTIEPCKKKLEIEVSSDIVLQKIDDAYSQIGKRARIPGFRQGKAPREFLEKHYANLAKEEALKSLIPVFCYKALEEANLIPLSHPEVSDVRLENAGPLFFRVCVEVKPEVKIKSYHKLKLNRKNFLVNEDDINKSLNVLQESNAEFKTVEGRGVKKGDWLLCDYEVRLEGNPIEEKKDHLLLVEETSFIPGLTEQIIEAMPGDIKEIKFNLPGDFFKAEYAKKEAILCINIKQIKEKSLPLPDDEFARDLGKFQDLNELKNAIREDLQRRNEVKQKEDLRNQMINQLLKLSSLSLPDSLVKAQIENLRKAATAEMRGSEFKEKEADLRKKELDDKLKPIAERQIKIVFILEKIAQIENIRISEEELSKDIEIFAQRLNRDLDEVKQELRKKDLLISLRQQLLEEKVWEFLLGEAEVSQE